MSLVGTFPTLGDPRRRTIRQAVNPLDKSTVVSIFPKVAILDLIALNTSGIVPNWPSTANPFSLLIILVLI